LKTTVGSNSFPLFVMQGLIHVKKKLVTKEDPLYLHKILGISALVSYFYRYYVCYTSQGTLGLGWDWLSWFTMALHFALSSSSLIFHVVAKRMKGFPMVIYEEYRMHTIVFTSRCVAVYIFGLLRPFAGTYIERVLLCGTVLVWHLLADEVTRRWGTEGVTAVRVNGQGGLDERSTSAIVSKSPFLMSIVFHGQKYYAFYQIAAVCCHLTPSEQTPNLGYNTLIAIQSSAFLMTLYRKSLIYQHSHAFWYSLALLMSLFHMYRIFPSPFFWARIAVVFTLRIFRVNKYVLYLSFALLVEPVVQSTHAAEAFDRLAVSVF